MGWWWSSGRLRCRGHLAAGHAVNAVIDEDDCDAFIAHGRVHDLGGADGSQVAVSLVCEDHFIGMNAFQTGGHCRRPAVGR